MYLNYQKQRGSALVIAIFVILVMLALAVGLSRLLISSSETIVFEVQGTRALFAAQSSLEIALSDVLYSGTSSCPFTNTPVAFSAAGLDNCNATISCSSYAVEGVTIYRLESTGQCAAAHDAMTSRTVAIEVRP